MPAPGDQYGGDSIKNPFEDRPVNGFTALEIATLQSRLNKQLGPEYISSRQGQGGGKVAYLEGNKAIALANEVFGFNGWSSSLGQIQIDYVDEHPQNGRISLGLSINVKIKLKDGTYHEDIGYGTAENQKTKGAAFEKAKKEAATDGLKRSLRTFGNVLGNCLYDKEYLKKVQSMKVKPVKLDEANMYRHPDFAPPVKDEGAMIKREVHQTPMRTSHISRNTTENSMVTNTEFEDEFGGDLFDGVEIGVEAQGEEFTFENVSIPDESAMKAIAPPNGSGSNRNSQGANAGPSRQAMARVQSMPAVRQQGGGNQQPRQQPNGPGRPPTNQPNVRGPQNPGAVQNGRPEQNRSRMPPPTVDIHAPPRPPHAPQPQNQQARPQPPQAQQPNSAENQRTTTPGPAPNPPAAHRPPVGFVTSRAAELMQNTESPIPLNLPAFNTAVDSPIPPEKRTPGIDHRTSRAIKRQEVNQPEAPIPPPQPQDPVQGQGPTTRPSNFINPHHDTNRRIGMPAAMSPLANRSAYKPPSMAGVKRPPLADVSNSNGGNAGSGDGPDAKKQKVDAPGVENGGAAVNT
ncbi:Rad52/22 family double-strand break repair protein-domain-containing protein [Lophiotrema nucula]|uniref:RAD52 homolog n=1 Tax=Lophiotrema nucula TaxID=690887 RepID=A0A6A5ZED7_9PLEO|nr:Rad52/22 family double-strand break repair protein-domain-containing protein [Lophiotrema nucula]